MALPLTNELKDRVGVFFASLDAFMKDPRKQAETLAIIDDLEAWVITLPEQLSRVLATVLDESEEVPKTLQKGIANKLSRFRERMGTKKSPGVPIAKMLKSIKSYRVFVELKNVEPLRIYAKGALRGAQKDQIVEPLADIEGDVYQFVDDVAEVIKQEQKVSVS